MSCLSNFFAFEGSDAISKATQADLLKKRLEEKGREVRIVILPRHKEINARIFYSHLGGTFGHASEINPYLAAPFFSYGRFLSGLMVRSLILEGYDVIAHSWTISSIAYQVTRLEGGNWVNFAQWVDDYEHEQLAIPRPFYLILHAGYVKEAEEDFYMTLEQLYPQALVYINCAGGNRETLPPEEIHEKVWQVVRPRLVDPP